MPSLRTIETFLRAFNIKSIAYVMLSTPFFQIGHSEWSKNVLNFQDQSTLNFSQ